MPTYRITLDTSIEAIDEEDARERFMDQWEQGIDMLAPTEMQDITQLFDFKETDWKPTAKELMEEENG